DHTVLADAPAALRGRDLRRVPAPVGRDVVLREGAESLLPSMGSPRRAGLRARRAGAGSDRHRALRPAQPAALATAARQTARTLRAGAGERGGGQHRAAPSPALRVLRYAVAGHRRRGRLLLRATPEPTGALRLPGIARVLAARPDPV